MIENSPSTNKNYTREWAIPLCSSGIELTSPLRLQPILEYIERAPIRISELVDYFTVSEEFAEISTDVSNVCGRLLEIHIQWLLRDIQQDFDHIESAPIQLEDGSENFLFRMSERVTQGCRVYRRNNSEYCYTEYDAVSMLHDEGVVPIVWESKLSFFHTSQRRLIASPGYRSRFLRPLAEYFGMHRFGLVIVMPSDKHTDDDEVVRAFQDEGGHVIHIPVTRYDFKNEVNRLIWG